MKQIAYSDCVINYWLIRIFDRSHVDRGQSPLILSVRQMTAHSTADNAIMISPQLRGLTNDNMIKGQEGNNSSQLLGNYFLITVCRIFRKMFGESSSANAEAETNFRLTISVHIAVTSKLHRGLTDSC